jgi:hypothetical protein
MKPAQPVRRIFMENLMITGRAGVIPAELE